MTHKFLTCDALVTRDDHVYVTELCPALSCHRLEVGPPFPNIRKLYAISMAQLSPEKFQMMQMPSEPDPVALQLVSHYNRDSKLFLPDANENSTIPKHKVRDYLSALFTTKKATWPALWVMFFRYNTINDNAEKFALILRKFATRMKIPLTIIDTYPLAYACERDKILYWQLLKIKQSNLLIPKEIFRFSTFNHAQKSKLAQFCSTLPEKQVIIKPINSSMTNGILVVAKENVIEVIDNLLPLYPSKGHLPEIILQETILRLKKLVYPTHQAKDKIPDMIVTIELTKFVNYWLSVDLAAVLVSERDFFLVEAFKPPKIVKEAFAQRSFGVVSRARFFSKNTQIDLTKALQVEGKRTYDLRELPPHCDYIGSIPLTVGNIYARSFIEKNPKIATDYFPRDRKNYAQIEEAFNQPHERSWINALTAMSVKELLDQIRATNPENRELLEYINSPSVLTLDLEKTEFCWHCFKMADISVLKTCAGCKQVYYCDAACQKADWAPFHKAECKLASQ